MLNNAEYNSQCVNCKPCITNNCEVCKNDTDTMIEFDNNGNLKKMFIYLSGYLYTENFPFFPELEVLSLNVDGFRYNEKNKTLILPKILFEYPKLTTLSFRGDIQVIPTDISDNNIIKEIHLHSNKIKTFPYQLSKLKHLEILDLSMNNELSGSLNKNIANFSKIRKIDLSSTQLTGELIIPETLEIMITDRSNFNSLKYIGKNRCKLQELSITENDFDDKIFESIQDFELLTDINLSGNMRINKVPSSISNFYYLETFTISNSNVKEISSNIFKLPKLQLFNIYSSPKLNIRIINFINKNVECNVYGANVLCYEYGSCKNMSNEYRNCTQEEINSVIRSQTSDIIKPKEEKLVNNETTKNHNFFKDNLTIIVILSIFLIIMLIITSINYICNKGKNNDDIIITKIETKKRLSSYNKKMTNQNNNIRSLTDNKINEPNKSYDKFNPSNIISNINNESYINNYYLPRYSELIDDDNITLLQHNDYKSK